MTPPRTDPSTDFAAVRDELGELAALVLAEVERAVAGWQESDPAVVEAVLEIDRQVDARSAALEERILGLHRNWSSFAADLRLLHVGLIAAVALERVGNLAVQIARLAGSVPPPTPDVTPVVRLIERMSERAVDALADGVQAIARGDLEAGERAALDARAVSPMLDRVLQAVTQAADGPGIRAWSAAAVLVARHVERIANNGAELGARVRFLVTGESAPAEEEPGG
jgi:phosphate transport system protein